MMNLEKIDPNLKLLFAGMVFFSIMLVGVEYFFKDDGQIFQVISSIIAGLLGAFLRGMNSSKHDPDQSTQSATIEITKPIEAALEPPK